MPGNRIGYKDEQNGQDQFAADHMMCRIEIDKGTAEQTGYAKCRSLCRGMQSCIHIREAQDAD